MFSFCTLSCKSIDVPPDRLGRRAVVAVEEIAEDRLGVLIGVLQKLGDVVTSQQAELAAPAAVAHRLRKDPLDAEALVEPHVRRHRAEVRKRIVVVGEIDDVVPHVQVRADLRPRLGAALVVGVERARLDRVAVAAGEHVAEPDGHVRVHHHAPRRLLGVHVRQRADQLVGIHLRGPLGQFVDEPELRAALGAVLLVHRPALRALAVVVPVHLREVVLAERADDPSSAGASAR